MKVHAAVAYEGQTQLSIEHLDLGDPGPDDILVRIAGCGLCHTDVKALAGRMGVPKPIVLGHEGAGVVERVGERVAGIEPGDHVVLTYDSCGVCHACAAGNPAYCARTTALNFSDGRFGEPGTFTKNSELVHGHFFGQSSFADFAMAKPRNAVVVRKDAPLEIAGVLGCSVQTGAGAVTNALQPPAGSSIAIFGVGPVGLSAVLGAVLRGCAQIIAVDVLPQRLELARKLGATHAVLAGPDMNPASAIRRNFPGGVNYSLDTTGRPDAAQHAIAALAPKGSFGFLTIPAGGLQINMSTVFLQGLSVRGIVQGDSVPHSFIPQLLDFFLAGRLPFDRFLTRYNLSQINQAIADQAEGKVAKPVFVMS
ncbi:MAG: NAD(P)-dependent alcohol dehydrogenase [Acidobacteriota bacterium]|nr:NAD(P)-dependent alcohol dehydrogenase [Acidobacteriota bacterium]